MSRRSSPTPAFDASVEIDPETRRTSRRMERLRRAIEARQSDLHLVIENVHDPHNVSAILRTCDAVGVGTVHLVYTYEEFPRFGKASSAGSMKWAELMPWTSIEECYAYLRGRGCAIWATDLSERAKGLYELDLVAPTALVFGNEHRGVSEEASRLADGNVAIPMVGLSQSLNVSVACAVTLYEAMRQRLAAGTYDTSSLAPEEVEAVLREWASR